MNLSNEDRQILKEALLAAPEFIRNPRSFFADALGGSMFGELDSYTGWAQDAALVASEILNRVMPCELTGGVPAVGRLAWAIVPLVGRRRQTLLRGLCERMAWRPPPKSRKPRMPRFTGRVLGNHQVGEKIGSGNFAVVFNGADCRTGEPVALKILKDRNRAAATELDLPNLHHPRILQPLADPGITEEGYTFFPLRQMKQTLRELMNARGGAFAWEEAGRLVLEIARALLALHDGDILHSDLKPENILLDEAGQPHIADFGLASRLSRKHAWKARKRAAGTPNYMAPDVFRKVYGPDPEPVSVDGKADIFSLGVILYELLSGQHPWGGDLDARSANLNWKPSSLGRIPDDLDEICRGCLAANPDDRIKNAARLVERLERLLRSHPTPSVRDSELRYLDLLLTEFKRIEETAKSYCALEGKADIRPRPETVPAITSGIFRYDLGLCVQFARAPKTTGENAEPRLQEYPYPDILRAFFDPEAALTRVVLLGGPGSGKSTTLRRLAQELATRAQEAQSDPPPPLPRFVSLRGWTGNESLEQFAAAELSRAVSGFGARIREPQASRPFVLLLDEWNQIPTEGRKERRQSLLSFVTSLADSRSGARIVVSCREDDYRGDLHLGFDTLTLKPLTPTRILDTLRQWLPSTPETAPDQAEDLFWKLAGSTELKAVFEKWRRGGASLEEFFSIEKPNDHQGAYRLTSGKDDALWMEHVLAPHSLMKLAANPFMLWMLFSAWWNSSPTLTLPRNRAELLTGFVHHLLFREGLLEVADSGNHRATTKGELLLRGITSLAWETFGVEKTGLAEFPRAQVLSAFRARNPAEDTEHLLEKALGATILEGADRLYFRHQLLQEYFAARALSARLGELSAVKIWPQDRWWQRNNREVSAVLMAGLHSDDCTKVVEWLADAQPEVAVRCIVDSGARVPHELLDRLQAAWSPRLNGPGSDPQPEARAALGRALGRLNLDRRPGVGLRRDGLPDISLVKIPGGRFLYGEEKKPRCVETLWIGRYPVTNAQYRAFLEAEDGYRVNDWWFGLDVDESDRSSAAPQWTEANCPRETVSWFQAMAFCAWLTHRLTQAHVNAIKVRLPAEWEWERAARGTNGREFPWGNEYVDGYANIGEDSHCLERSSAVGIYPDGAAREPGDSGNGIHDMAGNVWEWCLNRWEPASDTEPGGRESRVVRGGAWNSFQVHARADSRDDDVPFNCVNYGLGFRVVCSSPIPAEC